LNGEFVQAMRAADLVPGGMKAVDMKGREIVICNRGGTYRAIDRRCGHMNAPLEMGTLDGDIVTCPMHCAQFDITTGEALSGPVPGYLGGEVPPARIAAFLQNVELIMQRVRTQPIATFEVKVESAWVWVALPGFKAAGG
jgi:nitrite reductase/ring-hydroxylating ferredoxin subunit